MSVKRNLRDFLPRYYDDSPEIDAIITASADELDRLRLRVRDVHAQFYFDTATWGLANWERLLEITPDADDDYEVRRARIHAKWLIRPPMTVAKLEALASVFLNQRVTITELNSEYSFAIDFAFPAVEYHKVYEMRAGMTPIKHYDRLLSFSGLVEAIEYAKPAHLRPIYAPNSRERIRIIGSASSTTYEYHTVGEFRVGMTPIKNVREVTL